MAAEMLFKSALSREVKKYNPTISLSSEEYRVKQSEGKVAVFSLAIPHGRELLLGASPQDEHSLPSPYIP